MKPKSDPKTKRPATPFNPAAHATAHPAAQKPRQDRLRAGQAQRAQAQQPRVYSYARFSSPEQAKGDSKRRQWEAAEAYAQENGFVFDESLRMTDEGLSGYHGAHRKKGKLGAFLEKVESGAVARGSVLVVENIDRLGRESVSDALKTIVFGLLEYGITIVTLYPRHTYTTASLDDDDIWMLIADIKRANGESKRKSDLAKANWKQKRKLASEKILTKRVPAWLRYEKGQFELVEKAAETVQLIFKLKLDGFGKYAIERKLNQTAAWMPPKNAKRKGEGWRASYIEKILRNPAVVGEFQPHRFNMDEDGKRVRIQEGEPIANYFPAIVPSKMFHAVQKRIGSNKGTGGRTGKSTNVFQNLVKCAYCGGSMVFIDKGKTSKGGQYLTCDNGRRQVKDENGKPKCKKHSVRYAEFEGTLLDNLSKLRPENILPSPDEATQQAKQLRDTIAGLTGEVADVETKINNLISQIETTADSAIRARYEKRIVALGEQQAEAKAQQAQREAELHNLERVGQSFEEWQKNLTGLKEALAKDVDTRIRLKAHLKEFIERVDIFGTGDEEMVEHAEALIGEAAPEMERAKSYAAFMRYVRARLLSPEGRFFKLYLHSAQPKPIFNKVSAKGRKYTDAQKIARARGAGLEIAPTESLAGGVAIRPEGWRFSGPKVDKLSKEFFDARKPGFVPKASAL